MNTLLRILAMTGLILLAMLVPVSQVRAEVATYPGAADEFECDIYQVNVIQDGKVLKSFVYMNTTDWQYQIYFRHVRVWETISYSQFSFDRRSREELYDLKKDPHQMVNVAADPSYAETIRDLKGRLLSVMEETGDPRMAGDTCAFYYPPHMEANLVSKPY